MADYVSKEYLQFMFDKWKSQYEDFEGENKNSKLRKKLILKGYNECETIIEQAPTAEVEEVKHGEWISLGKSGFFKNIFQCSKCGRIEEMNVDNQEPYCHCGAKMDGGNVE